MPFEVFTRKGVTRSTEPHLSIQRSGAITMNPASFIALGSPAKVELLFDRERNRVGIRAADPTLPHAYPLGRTSTTGSHSINCKAFLDFYVIDLSQSRRYSAMMEAKILVVELNGPSAITTRPPGRRGSSGRH